KLCDHNDCVGPQCGRHLQKRNCVTTERSHTRIGSKFSIRHRSCLYAERHEGISARAIAVALIKMAQMGFQGSIPITRRPKKLRKAINWPRSGRESLPKSK